MKHCWMLILFAALKRHLLETIILIILIIPCQGLQPLQTTSWPSATSSFFLNIYSYFSSTKDDSSFTTILLNKYISAGKISLPCLSKRTNFAGKLILTSRSTQIGEYYSMVPSFAIRLLLPSRLHDCPSLITEVSLYLNIRKLQLSANQTLTITSQDSFLNNLTKRFVQDEYGDWKKNDRDSYGQFYSSNPVVEIAVKTDCLNDTLNSTATLDKTTSRTHQTKILIAMDFAIFYRNISAHQIGLSQFYTCPLLDGGILPAEFFCNPELIVCPNRHLIVNTSEAQPSLQADYQCDLNGLPYHATGNISELSPTQPTEILSSLSTSSPSYSWWRPTSKPFGRRASSNFRDGLVYSSIVLSVIIVVGLGLFVLHYVQSQRKMSAPFNNISHSATIDFSQTYGEETNLGMINDDGEPPPPYTPPGAPPSYCESQEGNVCVILRRDDDDGQPPVP